MKRTFIAGFFATLTVLAITAAAVHAGVATGSNMVSFYTPTSPSTHVVQCGETVNIVALERTAPLGEFTYEARFYASGGGRLQLVTPGESDFVRLPGDTDQRLYTLTVHRAPNGPTPLALVATGPDCNLHGTTGSTLTIIAPTLFANLP